MHPTHREIPAGMDSVVDNTVRFKPLPPRYGKTREVLPNEIAPVMRNLAPDLLASSKGLNPTTLPVIDSPGRMGAVLGPYSPNAALYSPKFDPERRTAGFLRTPNALAGSTYVDEMASRSAATFRIQTHLLKHSGPLPLTPVRDDLFRSQL